jgi:hypothetical protein
MTVTDTFVDYYKVLGVPNTATTEQIDDAAKRELQRWIKATTHPNLAKRQEAEQQVLAAAGSVIADKGFQGSGYITPIKKPQNRKLLSWEHDYNRPVWKDRVDARRSSQQRSNELLMRYSEPLARAAFDLQSRLYNICRKWFMTGSGTPEEHRRFSTLWLFGQFLGWVEIVRREVQVINYGDIRRTAEHPAPRSGRVR